MSSTSNEIWAQNQGVGGSRKSRTNLAMTNHSAGGERMIQQQPLLSNQRLMGASAYQSQAGKRTMSRIVANSNNSHDSNQEDYHRAASEGPMGGEATGRPALVSHEPASDQDLPAAGQQLQQQLQGKRGHVGPMGIFFKVWSLVKVTKSRHQQRQLQNGLLAQRLRRQNSEDTSNHYSSHGELTTMTTTSNTTTTTSSSASGGGGGRAILQDRHFRRAGSQPASSRLLLAAAAASNGGAHWPAAATAAATNSCASSSGVSSTTSSTLAANSASSPANSSSSSSGGQLRQQQQQQQLRHLSAGSLRPARAALHLQLQQQPPPPLLKNQAQPAANKQQQQQQTNSSGKDHDWLARMKRSGTAGSLIVGGPQAAAAAAATRLRRRDSELKSMSLSDSSDGSRRSSSDEPEELDDYDDYEYKDDEEEEEEAQDDDDNDDEEESNDIYSTPNDSIQSVPSGQRAPAPANSSSGGSGCNQAQPQQQPHAIPAGSGQPNSAYPAIIKSFSTSNFQQQQQQQQQQQGQARPLARLAGRQQQQRDGRAGAAAGWARNKNSSSECGGGGSSSAKRPSSGFFISSSSSEDSAAAAAAASAAMAIGQQQQQQQQRQLSAKSPPQAEAETADRLAADKTKTKTKKRQQQAPQKASLPGVASGADLSCESRQVPVSQGVHCHISRPGSLLLPPVESINQFLVPSMQMLTPAGAPLAGAVVYLGLAGGGGGVVRSPAAAAAVQSGAGIRSSASLFEFPPNARFSSKYPPQVSSFQQQQQQQRLVPLMRMIPPQAPSGGQNLNTHRQSMDSSAGARRGSLMMPSSISMFDFKSQQQQQQTTTNFSSITSGCQGEQQPAASWSESIEERSEYRLAEMMLESGSNPNARDANGNTALAHAIQSDNLPAIKCLIQHGANLNDSNPTTGLSLLDLACARQPNSARLEILKLLIDNGADLDRQRDSDRSRLLDRLIEEHGQLDGGGGGCDKLAFIECLLESGAKLGSSTWSAARGKLEIQLSLLRKLCQDGYFLYKQCSIEAAVFRFEYALRRIAELEQQLLLNLMNSNSAGGGGGQNRRKYSSVATRGAGSGHAFVSPELAATACKQIKYQTYLGLSRCERKRKFYKRALEFAQLAILVDSTSYEGFYSRAHILKDLGEIDDSLLTIDQTARLVEKTLDNLGLEVKYLEQQEEQLIMDTCFDLDRESCRHQSSSFARIKSELQANISYLEEARKYVAKLRQDIMDDKFKSSPVAANQLSEHREPIGGGGGPIAAT